ncbi:MAG: hypothetical protein ACREJC_15690 [Tepidisphaeraceae bacterium]
MSQYPYPSPFDPNMGYTQSSDPRAPARRAAVLMWVLGALALLMGGCLSAIGASWSKVASVPEMAENLRQLEEQIHGSPQGFFVAFGIGMLLGAFVLIVIGVFLRGGGFGASLAAVIVASIMVLFFVVQLIGSLRVLSTPGAVVGVLIVLMLLALCVLLLVWSIQALKNASLVRAMQGQFMAQQWPHPASPEYPQGGYGYPTQPPQPPSGDANLGGGGDAR